MKKTARVLQAALTTSLLLFGVLPLSGSAAGAPEGGDSYSGLMDWTGMETLFCQQCGAEETFYLYASPEGARRGEDFAPTGSHWEMTLCLNCGTINGDLPTDDSRFDQALFRLEDCPAEHHLENILYEPVDGGSHRMTGTDSALCPQCGGAWEQPAEVLEPHQFAAEAVAPTADAGGYTTYTCTLCGYSYREDETPPLSQQGETDPDPFPDPTPDPTPEPVPEPAPDLVPELSPMPETLSHRAYIEGMPGGLFAPSRSMTRAEGAVMLARLVEESLPSAADGSFEDVPADAWYAEAVNRLAAAGVVRGRTARTFAPQAEITRAEFAALAARIFPTGGAQGDRAFPDVPASHWAAEEIGAAEALGWIQGYPDGTFRPDAPITRAEAVAVLNRVLGR